MTEGFSSNIESGLLNPILYKREEQAFRCNLPVSISLMQNLEPTKHIPVLLSEVVENLNAKDGGIFLDCTLGGGGHAEAILKANPNNKVIAIDRDLRAIERAKIRLSAFEDRLTIYHASFKELSTILKNHQFVGILADLGVSTDQLKEGRGFSFNDEASLDMRMDESDGITAFELINNASETELFLILKKGGADKEASLAAKSIVNNRPINSSKELSRIVNQGISRIVKTKSTNPSTVVFQAIRMAVNQELQQIESFLEFAKEICIGRIAVITFHSAEDKLVAATMRGWESGGAVSAASMLPPGISFGKMVTKQGIEPSEEEVARNSASRSAKLRVFEVSNKR